MNEDPEKLREQIRKLSKVTELIAEGNFFYYHPQEEHSNPDGSLALLSRNFNKMISRIKEHQNVLEDQVAARTDELRRTLEEVEAVKAQQDADYYLTSQLLKPLGANKAQSDVFDIDFLVRQKKEFRFYLHCSEVTAQTT